MTDSSDTSASYSRDSSTERGGNFKSAIPPATADPETASEALARFKARLADYLDPEYEYPRWTPSRTFKHQPAWNKEERRRLEALHIPKLRAAEGIPPSPDIPLYGLGRLEEFDPAFSARIADFMSGSDHLLLVNVSGSGKTRLVFETLARSWGFYFTCSQDLGASPYGSDDLGQAFRLLRLPSSGVDIFTYSLRLPSQSPTDVEQLATNRRIAKRVFRRLLLARFLVFELFQVLLKDRTYSLAQAQQKWLMLQLRPSVILGVDIFYMLMWLLQSTPDADVATELARLYSNFGTMLDFIAVDEAQIADATLHKGFATRDGKAFAPVLRELVANFYQDCPRQRLIISGTNVAMPVVSEALRGCGAEQGLRFFYDLGQFDALARAQSFLRHFFSDAISPQQCTEVFRWLRGRHRFMTIFVYHLLLTGPSRLEAVLDMLVSCLCGHERRDDDEDYLDDRLYGIIIKDSTIEEWPWLARHLRDALFTFALRREPTTFVERASVFVAIGLAIFSNPNARATISEPLVFYRLLVWFQKSERHTIGRIIDEKLDDSSVIARGTPFAAGVAAYLWNTFSRSGARLGELLRFEGPRAPWWSANDATLVLPPSARRRGKALKPRGVIPDTYSITGAQNPTEVLGWLSGGKHAFLVPDSALDADLLFFLRVQSAGIVLVFLHLEPFTAERPRRTRMIVPPDPSTFYARSRTDHTQFLAALKDLPEIHFDRQRHRPLALSMLHLICFTRAYREDREYNPPVARLDFRCLVQNGHAPELDTSQLDYASLQTAV